MKAYLILSKDNWKTLQVVGMVTAPKMIYFGKYVSYSKISPIDSNVLTLHLSVENVKQRPRCMWVA